MRWINNFAAQNGWFVLRRIQGSRCFDYSLRVFAFSLLLVLGFETTLCAEGATIRDYLINRAANKAYALGQTEEAISGYSKVMARGYLGGEVPYNLGNVFYADKQYDRAEEAYQKALTLLDKKQHGRVYYNLGNLMVQKADFETAVTYYKKALQINPDDYNAKYNLEYVLLKLKQQHQQKNEQEQKDQEKKNKDQQKQNQQKQKDQSKQDQKKSSQNQEEKKKQEELEKQKEEARKRALLEQEQRQENVQRILNALDQKEREVRMQNLKKYVIQGTGIIKDW